MALFFDEITIELAGETVYLRPKLRAAARLERRYNGFSNIIADITEGKLSAIADVIRESADTISSIPAFLETLEGRPLGPEIERIVPLIVQLILRMAGLQDAPTERADKGDMTERISFGTYFELMFGYGTGVLGWEPETVWNATPAEITAAYRTRCIFLSTLFGTASSETESSAGPRVHTKEEIKQGIATLHALAASAQRGA